MGGRRYEACRWTRRVRPVCRCLGGPLGANPAPTASRCDEVTWPRSRIERSRPQQWWRCGILYLQREGAVSSYPAFWLNSDGELDRSSVSLEDPKRTYSLMSIVGCNG